MEYLVFLGADQADNPPSQQFCKQFADKNGVDPAKMLIDPDFQTLFSNLDSGQSGGIGLPWDGIVNGDGMVYEWNATLEGDPLTVVDKLLAE